MEIIIKLDPDFHPDSSEHATVLVYRADMPTEVHNKAAYLGTVAILFTEGPDHDQHVVQAELPGMPHYAQAKIIYEASMMLDTHFAPDGRDPQVKAEFDA